MSSPAPASQVEQNRFRRDLAFTILIVAVLSVLYVTAVPAARIGIGIYAVLILIVMGLASGRAAFEWPYPDRRRRSLWRLIYPAVRVSRVVQLLLGAVAVAAFALSIVAGVITVGFLFVDLALDGSVGWENYADFYTDELPEWVDEAGRGRAGAK
jgi:hypothetical protein